MKKAYDSKNNLNVIIVSASGGWTTVLDHKGNQYKLRNSQVEAVKAEDIPTKEQYAGVELAAKERKARLAAVSFAKLEADPTAEADDFDTTTPKTTRHILTAEVNLDDYVKVKSAAGRNSLDCGDTMARLLRGKTLDEVYALAAEKLGVPEQELRARYAHLNNGMQRMNLSNRMRAV